MTGDNVEPTWDDVTDAAEGAFQAGVAAFAEIVVECRGNLDEIFAKLVWEGHLDAAEKIRQVRLRKGTP